MRKTPALPSFAASSATAGLGFEDAESLTAQDRETLAHLLRRGMGRNTLRAVRSDLAYLEAWCQAVTGEPLPWPPGRTLVLRFIAHHLWDPEQRAVDRGHGMPDDVREVLVAGGYLRASGPHAPATVRRRLSTWRSLCSWQDLEHPFSDAQVRRAVTASARASAHRRQRKSPRAVDLPLMERILDHLDTAVAPGPGDSCEARAAWLRALRDRALLAVMFASGGRRRSEISDLVRGQLAFFDPIPVEDPDWPDGLPSAGLALGRTKTTRDEEARYVYLTGRSVLALEAWLRAAAIETGPVFLRIDRWARIFESSVSGHSVNAILKARLAEIGESPADFSAHGVRAGYISTALKAGIPAPEIMEQTLHRSMPTLLSYFKDEQQRVGRAARIL